MTLMAIEDKFRPARRIVDDLRPIKVTIYSPGVAKLAEIADKARRERERDEITATVRAQPHRLGSDDPRLHEPLGQFLAPLWPNDDHYRHGAYNAGDDYARRVREARLALGLAGSSSGTPAALPASLGATPDQIEARKELALMRLGTARGILINIHRRLPRAMERLTFDQLDPWPCDEAMLINGLYSLAVEFGFIKLDKSARS